MRSKRIINNSPRRGRNKVTEGNHVLIWFQTWDSTCDCRNCS
jgi:hypothetical protein